ncbi:MAG TPA: pyridoxal-phosphate dependent enzyme [Polyangiaceae bacterium]|nr:pyridoxal-phosphate dependent enzyme [Polyangiaceae bacterium]
MIGTYPTPVERLADLSTASTELWIKRDDIAGDLYGGNKVRRLDKLLDLARSRGARRILTLGAAGSHHVLACSIYASRAGLRTAAVLTPQPAGDHAVSNLKIALGQGLEAFAARSLATAPFVFASVWRKGDLVVAPGGSSVVGTTGYAEAAFELGAQIESGALAMPDAIVVALGSAGTAAGLLAGTAIAGLPIKVIAVRIVEPWLMGKWRALSLARRVARHLGKPVSTRSLAAALEIDARFLGNGYGHPTREGARAVATGARSGVVLDPTYTAKAFAACLDIVASGRYRRVLYWHTLSSRPLSQFVEQTPAELPPNLRSLFT